ncbi:MAG: hypothetical protein ACOYBR_07880 [Fluviibacter sp.]
MIKKLIKKTTLAMLFGTLLPMGVALAEGVSPIPTVTDEFRFSLTPYVWTPGITGNIDYNNVQRAHTHISTDKVLSNLATGAMLDGEVHYGHWGVMGNATFAKLSNQGSKTKDLQEGLVANVDSTSDAWLGVYTVAGTYTAYASPSLYVDALVGARWLNLNAKIQLDASIVNTPYTGAKTLYSSLHTTDAIGGVKGRVRLGETSYFVPFYLDAGGGSSTAKFTSQQMLGIGYAFKGVDLALYWNNLYYSLSNGNVSSYVNMTGPALAATFRF